MRRRILTHEILGELPPASEEDSLVVLDRFATGTLDYLDATRLLRDSLRTSSVYVLDRDAVSAILESEPPELPELPPLPFSRVTIEFSRAGEPVPFDTLNERPWSEYLSPDEGRMPSDPDLQALLVTLLEVDPGREWRVLFPIIETGGGSGVMSLPFLVTPERADPIGLTSPGGGADAAAILAGEWARTQAVLLAHIITARGVPATRVGLPRQQRREYQRKHGGSDAPIVYEVNLHGAGDGDGEESGRHYHCRWLVRGHWRHLSDGRRTWVRPHVKGPVGAPWKGRQVRVGG